jgi:carboxyl-terminal processing protease
MPAREVKMTISFKTLAVGVFYSVLLSVSAFFAGYQSRSIWPPASEQYGLLKEADQLLRTHYIGELPDQLDLQRGMIRGMVAEIDDPYTAFMEPVSHELQTDDLVGEYGGVGAFLSQDEEGIFHLIPFSGSPAERAGIQEGDVLIAVDDQPVHNGIRLDTVLAMIRGPVGTSVKLTLAARSDEETSRTVEIIREAFPIPSVTSYVLPSNSAIGVIVIHLFSEKTLEESQQAYHELLTRGVRAILLDLRDNVGGLLDSGVDVARFFLTDGLVLIEQRKGDEREYFRVESVGEASDVPLAVLVNGGTASAAEVVAAALQANHRAPLVGIPTYGKGSVQVVVELSDGSSLHITSARWQTPDGVIIDNQGLQPDVSVTEPTDEQDAIIFRAVEWLQSSIKGNDEGFGN